MKLSKELQIQKLTNLKHLKAQSFLESSTLSLVKKIQNSKRKCKILALYFLDIFQDRDLEMKLKPLHIVFGLAILLVLGYFVKSRETFKVLGALGNQKQVYYRCLSECEKSDPAKQMSPSKGSKMCQVYCDSVLTDVTRRGGPSYLRDFPVAEASATSIPDTSFTKCGDGTHGEWCRSQVSTAGEIDEKCRQDCAYSTLPEERCMRDCTNILVGNKSSGWSWK